MAATLAVYPPLDQRPTKNTIVLFDVDDTLTKPRQVWTIALSCLDVDADYAPVRHTKDAAAALGTASQVCHWLRRRLQPRKAARAARRPSRCHLIVRLLLRRERAYGDTHGRGAGKPELHWVDR
jgi:hypothetical protein